MTVEAKFAPERVLKVLSAAKDYMTRASVRRTELSLRALRRIVWKDEYLACVG